MNEKTKWSHLHSVTKLNKIDFNLSQNRVSFLLNYHKRGKAMNFPLFFTPKVNNISNQILYIC